MTFPATIVRQCSGLGIDIGEDIVYICGVRAMDLKLQGLGFDSKS